ncbi:MAG: L-2-hydroxyglutarate oxidase [Rhodothermales bacterium]
MRYDVAIVGAGIVGLATGYQLGLRHPGLRIVLLEKEAAVAQHQTGHNSGVLHSGIYYKPGSLKAQNCREGKLAMQRFCETESIPFALIGKVIVATSERELPMLDAILERGQANGVRCEKISRERLLELEPHVAGIQAIHVPEAGIVDYKAVSRRLAACIQERGGQVMTQAEVLNLVDRPDAVTLETRAGTVEARHVVNCGGLYSDRVVSRSGGEPGYKIVPFRGEYFELVPEAEHLCRTLIYPVPDPSFPFLGVHFTRMIGGGVECGPNAVLAFAREGYSKRVVRPGELLETLAYSGFRKLAAKHWRTGAGEMWRSFSKGAFVRALQVLVPEIRAEHLHRAPAGVRAQAVAPDGKMVDDFLIRESGRLLHVCNAPSPAATASLNIGRLVVERLEASLDA